MAKKFVDKMKQGVSVNELEGFANKNTTIIFSSLAVIIGAISSSYDFFTGPRLTILFLAIGVLIAMFFSAPVERGLKQLYRFTFKQEKLTEIILGVVKIIVAIFIPFLYFGLLGLLAGTSYHYYIRHAQITSENRPRSSETEESDDEHD
jgi:hypothetical protein